jgi:hypothetical protein
VPMPMPQQQAIVLIAIDPPKDVSGINRTRPAVAGCTRGYTRS